MNRRHHRNITAGILTALTMCALPLAAQVRTPTGTGRPPVVTGTGVGTGAGSGVGSGAGRVPGLPGGSGLGPVGSAPTPTKRDPVAAQPGGSPPQAARAATAIVPCQVTTLSESADNSCSTRYITSSALYASLRPCTTGQCYAARLLQMAVAPRVTVVLPQATAQRAQAAAQLRAELSYAVSAMATDLKARVNAGESGLPAMSEIDDLVTRARAEVEAIDQPVDETPEQRRRRLGLGPATQALARQVRQS